MKWQQKTEKQARAKQLGYETIEEAFIKLYEIHQSTSIVGELMGVTNNSAKYVLKRLGVTLRGRGGNNNKRFPSKPQKDTLESMTEGKWYTARQIPNYIPKKTASALAHLWRKGKVERKVYKEITAKRYVYRKL